MYSPEKYLKISLNFLEAFFDIRQENSFLWMTLMEIFVEIILGKYSQ
jgi:hypothetical protein